MYGSFGDRDCVCVYFFSEEIEGRFSVGSVIGWRFFSYYRVLWFRSVVVVEFFFIV